MKEDDLTNRIISYNDTNEEYGYIHHPEQHYNHYGSRGVVDLHEISLLTTSRAAQRVRSEHLYEIKGESAIRNSTGANEIVRQYNKMCSYFYLDESNHRPEPLEYAHFELTFLPTEPVIEHIWNNRHIYSQLKNSEVNGVDHGTDVRRLVTLRSPDPSLDGIYPVHIDSRHTKDQETWLRHARAMNETIATAIESALF